MNKKNRLRKKISLFLRGRKSGIMERAALRNLPIMVTIKFSRLAIPVELQETQKELY